MVSETMRFYIMEGGFFASNNSTFAP
jgi:hypothetical protein